MVEVREVICRLVVVVLVVLEVDGRVLVEDECVEEAVLMLVVLELVIGVMVEGVVVGAVVEVVVAVIVVVVVVVAVLGIATRKTCVHEAATSASYRL